MSAHRVSRPRRPAAEISGIVEAFQSSGLSQRAFCSQRDLSVNTLNGWLRKRRVGGSVQPSAPQSDGRRLIPVRLTVAAQGARDDEAPILEIVLRNHRSIRVLPGSSSDQLRRLLEAVEAL